VSHAHAPLGRVLIAGATGLVGREALNACLRDPGVVCVRALLRRPLALDGVLGPLASELPALDAAQRRRFESVQVDFQRLDRTPDPFCVDTVFCALGTTIRQAGSQEAFRRVDFEAPLQIARLAHAQGARRFLLVSALGASSSSRVFYNRVKGELEDAVSAMGFEQLLIARPSLLDGNRAESRPAERLGLMLAKAFGFLIPESHRPVHVRQVATTLLQAAGEGGAGRRVLTNAQMRAMR
jgi:uncharacterized protein YbjT (DUF2867 family)